MRFFKLALWVVLLALNSSQIFAQNPGFGRRFMSESEQDSMRDARKKFYEARNRERIDRLAKNGRKDTLTFVSLGFFLLSLVPVVLLLELFDASSGIDIFHLARVVRVRSRTDINLH